MEVLQAVGFGMLFGGLFVWWWQRRYGGNIRVVREELLLLRAERTHTERVIQELQVDKRHQERLLEERLQRLSSAEAQFLEEKNHMRRTKEEEQEELLRKQDRLWAEFESTVQRSMHLACADKRIGLRAYDNTQLPLHFSGAWKPDMLVEVGESYVVFDAKMSRSQQLDTYLRDQVKKTTQKLRTEQQIFPIVFFVVPTEQLSTLRETVLHEEHMTFVILPVEAVFGVLYTLKLLAVHETVGGMDGDLHGTLVTVLALLVQHMDVQHAVNALFVERGKEVKKKLGLLPETLREEVVQKQQQLRLGIPSAQAVKERMAEDQM